MRTYCVYVFNMLVLSVMVTLTTSVRCERVSMQLASFPLFTLTLPHGLPGNG